MKTKFEIIFGLVFFSFIFTLIAGVALFLFYVTKPLHAFILSHWLMILWIFSSIFILIIAMRNLRSNYRLYLLIDGEWRLEGTFESITDMHQYVEDHKELKFDDYKFKTIRHA